MLWYISQLAVPDEEKLEEEEEDEEKLEDEKLDEKLVVFGELALKASLALGLL